MEKFSILNRRKCFWYVQILGLVLIFAITFIFKFSILSVVCGIIFSYAQMEIWLRFVKNHSFLMVILKNIMFLGIFYLMVGFLNGFSFLLGLVSLFVFLAGISLEVLKYGSL